MKKISQIIKEIEEDKNKPTKPNGVPSGFRDLDRLTEGFQNGRLTILAARPAMGTTSLALNFAINAARLTNTGVLLFSLDNTAKSLAKRILNANRDSENTKDLKIYIEDTPGISILAIMDLAAKLKYESNIGFIIIDYLQLITKFELNQQKHTEADYLIIARLLQILTKCLNIPVLVLSKLSREVEIRGGDKRPLLPDISEYGNIENFIDVVILLYRPSYYGITEDEEGNNLENLSELLISKNRNRKTGRVYLRHNFDKSRFEDADYKPC